jgi:hypothetical protein
VAEAVYQALFTDNPLIVVGLRPFAAAVKEDPVLGGYINCYWEPGLRSIFGKEEPEPQGVILVKLPEPQLLFLL